MTEATLTKVNLDQIKKHYADNFKPNVSYLVITGDVTKAQAMKQAQKYFGKWQKGAVAPRAYPTPRAPEKTQVDFVNKAGAVQSVIVITYPVDLAPGTPDVIRSRVTNAILGGYFNSRVNANLREGHGWTYGARTSLSSDKLVGDFRGTCSVRNAVTDSSIIEFLKEMNKMRDVKVEAQELQVVKNVLAGQFSQSLEEPGTVAEFALNQARYNIPADYYQKYLEALQAVTPEEVMAMAQKYIRPDKAHILVVGNKDDVSERIRQFSPDKKVNFYDAFGNPVKSINATMPAGMTAEKVIEDYVNAIGGTAKIAGIKDLQSTATMETRGPKFGIKTWQKGGDKIAIEMTMNGQVMSKQVFDGVKGTQGGMGAPSQELSGRELEDIREQAQFCKEAGYAAKGYKTKLSGLEEVNGSVAYIVEVTRPDGKKTTEYYDMKSSFKLREVAVSEDGPDGQPVTQVTDMSDYKPVNGVFMPYTIVVSGVFPVPFKVMMDEVKVNAGVEDTQFKH
jgi:zinc protease